MSTVISAGTTTNTAYNVNADTSGSLALATGSGPTTAVYIDGSQNVGIGTSSPGYKLTVSGGGASFPNNYGIFLPDSSNANDGTHGGGINFASDNNFYLDAKNSTSNFIFRGTSYAERMRIDSSGNLLVGTTTQATGALLTVNGSIKGVITSGTAVASTSGTSIDFTSIPSWVKRITVMFKGVSASSNGVFITQLGAGSVTTTGYTSSGWGWTGGTNGLATTAGLLFQGQVPASGTVYNAIMTINNFGNNAWVSQAIITAATGTVDKFASTGAITLGGTLDRIRITTTGGTDTFTAGSINIQYEG